MSKRYTHKGQDGVPKFLDTVHGIQRCDAVDMHTRLETAHKGGTVMSTECGLFVLNIVKVMTVLLDDGCAVLKLAIRDFDSTPYTHRRALITVLLRKRKCFKLLHDFKRNTLTAPKLLASHATVR